MSGKREIQSTIYLFIEYFVKLISGLVTNIAIVRTLGPELNGKFSYILSYSTSLMPLYVMGINEYMIKDLKSKIVDENTIMGTSFVLKMIGGVIATLIVIVAICFTENVLENKILIVCLSIFLSFKAFEVIDNWYLYLVESKRISMLRNFVLVFSSILKVSLCLLGYSWQWIVAVAILDSLFYVIPYLYLYSIRDKKSFLKWNLDTSLLKKYFKLSFQFLVVTVLAGFIFKIDQIFVGKLLGPKSLGEYAAATRLIEFWQFAPMILISVYFPKLVEASHLGEDNLKKFLEKFYSVIVIVATLFAIFVTLLSGVIIELLYGKEYLVSGKVLSYYTWIVIPLYFWWARMRVAIILHEMRSEIYVSVLTVLIAVLLYIWLIPIYGLTAPILSLLIAMLSANIIVSFSSSFIRNSLKSFVSAYVNTDTYARLVQWFKFAMK